MYLHGRKLLHYKSNTRKPAESIPKFQCQQKKNPGERHLQRCRSDLRFQPLVEHGVMELPGQRHRHLGRAKNPPATRLVQTVTTLSKAACDVPEQGGPKSPNQSQHQNGAAAPPVNQIVL
jgi:hypothetical protein